VNFILYYNQNSTVTFRETKAWNLTALATPLVYDFLLGLEPNQLSAYEQIQNFALSYSQNVNASTKCNAIIP